MTSLMLNAVAITIYRKWQGSVGLSRGQDVDDRCNCAISTSAMNSQQVWVGVEAGCKWMKHEAKVVSYRDR